MSSLRWVHLTDEERVDLLGTGGIGVLSFSTEPGEPPASLPVSYGYDSGTDCLYFRLSFPPGSSKETIIDNPVSLVTYDEVNEGWHSVVATGRLEELTDLPYESVAVQRMWAIEIPTVDVFDRPRSEIEFHDFRLDPDSLTGRKSVS
ncbi:pyridoxamine 5'-phosphate oxidase family protein [Halovivax gelatinilyticus]|uniref:pyridoxamine 5'-phosphate oxidase family protein n=1 Tax=Halovivax gelatinilyticus TaxID=2961597 RepID=UPI0020CA8509|nr:pyridoxamine 5'-phosphate oxidase family protein [Halovivax gelatinilyticus]